jgi:LemA protein
VADNHERIARMEAEGVLTPRQAEMLRTSLTPRTVPVSAQRFWARERGQLVLWIIGGLSAIGLLAMTLFAGGPGDVQNVADTLNEAGGYGHMNRALASILAIGLLFVVPLVLFVYFHNALIAKEETVSKSWAQVESNFQRRADLIPALVQTVSRYLSHERETLTTITSERAQATDQVSSAVDKLIEAQKEAADVLREADGAPTDDQGRLDRLFAAQRAVGGRMGALFAVVEAYPDLRSADQFLELQAQIEGTENRINVARQRFNDAVGNYNAALRMMPWNLVAMLGGFNRKAYFRSEQEASDAPALAFD